MSSPPRPKPKRVSEAQRQMQERMEEYQQKREQRVKEKQAEEARKEREKAERRAKEQEKLKRYSSPVRSRSPTARQKSPVKPTQAETKTQKQEEAEFEKAAALAKEKEEAAIRAQMAKEKANKKTATPEQQKANKKQEAAAQKKKAVQEQPQKEKAAEQAQKKAQNARLEKWKQEQEKKRKAAKAAGGDGPPVERVPKLSALLAMGGPEAEEYHKKAAQAKLGTWKSNAGDKWEILEQTFEGASMSEVTQDEVVTGIPVEEAVEMFQTNPEKYLAMHYWPDQPTEFTYILRAGTVGYEPLGVRTDGGGRLVLWRHMYKRLKPLKENVLPTQCRDKHTDTMVFDGKKLHANDQKDKNKPLLPGRGMGIGDEANMEMVGSLAQPSHIRQGACVGDCWLLSAIACLADFDWAVKRLFRKTTSPSVEDRPQDEPNQYTVTLWDLKTWKEVDVVVDERLPVRSDGSGFLLGARPSTDGKFWVPYLEKAIAAHCGGYDKLNGGNCTDAWPMLTGSRNQFIITKSPKTGKYLCSAKYNLQEQKWSDHSNSPHDSNPAVWRVDWPVVGGGGNSEVELSEDDLFQRVITWDEHNFLVGAATAGASDKQSTDGIVDNHAYSIIDSRQNICGTGIDLLLIRNPWGEGGELKNGQFMRSGPGWSKYPDIQKELNPAMEDNGLCWVTKKEFFHYFPTIYLSAFNMTRLQDANYVNDLEDHFPRRPKAAPKTASKKPASNEDEIKPIHVKKTSDPSSPYKIVEETFNGGVAFSEMNKTAVKGTSIAKGVDEFRANPEKYLAIHYQRNMVEEGWPVEMHQFTYIFRDGTEGLEVDVAPNGKRTMLTNVLR